MSLFKKEEKTGSVYHWTDSLTTKKTTLASKAFDIKMNIIRRGSAEAVLLGDIVGDFVANVNGKYTNADKILKADKIVWDGGTYEVVNEPRKNILFNSYKLELKRSNL